MPGSDWDEIPKVLNLIEHYNHHESRSQEKVSISDFLFLHYSANSEHPKEDNCKLPFQHAYNCAYTAELIYTDFSFILITHYPERPVLHIPKETRDHVSSVFQPPQTV